MKTGFNSFSMQVNDPFMAFIFGRGQNAMKMFGNYDTEDDDEEDNDDYDPDEDLHMMFDDEEYDEMHESY